MARVNEIKHISSFEGGLVTDFNRAELPDTFLSSCNNVDITVNGLLESRKPFSKLFDTVELESQTTYKNLKTFFWREMGLHIVAYTKLQSIYIHFTGPGIDQSFSFSNETGLGYPSTSSFERFFDISFEGASLFFPINYVNSKGTSVPYVFKGVLENGSITICSPFQKRIGFEATDREPEIGEEMSRTGDNIHYGCYFPFGVYGTATVYWNSAEVITVAKKSLERGVDGGDGYVYYLGKLVDSWDWSAGNYKHMNGVYRITSGALGEDGEYSIGSQPLYYRDLLGLPNYLSKSIDQTIRTTDRPIDGSAFFYYNLFNAGWGNTNVGVKYVSNAEATATADVTTGKSLAYVTKDTINRYPSLCDTPHSNIVESTNTVEAIGLFSPYVLKHNQPFTNNPFFGRHVLQYGKEYEKGDNENDGSYFIPPSIPKTAVDSSDIQLFDEFLDSKKRTVEVSAICSAFGRNWYGVTGSDSFNIMYSQQTGRISPYISGDLSQRTLCFQTNDPTQEDFNELVDTDGGVFKIDGSGVIYKIVTYKEYIVFFCEFGVWAVCSEPGKSFKPTSYTVVKVSDKGCLGKFSVAVTDDTLFYASNKGVHVISKDRELVEENISNQKIKNLYLSFVKENPSEIKVVYDSVLNLLYLQKRSVSRQSLKELSAIVLNLDNLAFFTSDFLSYTLEANEENPFLSAKRKDDGQEFTVVNCPIGLEEGVEGVCFVTCTSWSEGGSIHIGGDLTLFYKADDYLGNRVDGVFENPLQAYTYSAGVLTSTLGHSSTDKNIGQILITQFNGEELLSVDERTIYKRPGFSLRYGWDLNKNKQGVFNILGEIKYPEVANIGDSSLLRSMFKIPGRGKVLTLSIEDNGLGEHLSGFRLLSIDLEYDASGRM